MSEPLTREELLKEVCMLCSIDNEQRDRPHREAIENHDAAIRARLAESQQEVEFWVASQFYD